MATWLHGGHGDDYSVPPLYTSQRATRFCTSGFAWFPLGPLIAPAFPTLQFLLRSRPNGASIPPIRHSLSYGHAPHTHKHTSYLKIVPPRQRLWSPIAGYVQYNHRDFAQTLEPWLGPGLELATGGWRLETPCWVCLRDAEGLCPALVRRQLGTD